VPFYFINLFPTSLLYTSICTILMCSRPCETLSGPGLSKRIQCVKQRSLTTGLRELGVPYFLDVQKLLKVLRRSIACFTKCQLNGVFPIFRRRAPGSKTEEKYSAGQAAGGAGCPRRRRLPQTHLRLTRRGVPPDPNLRLTCRLETVQ
jgi:hypothetical protein